MEVWKIKNWKAYLKGYALPRKWEHVGTIKLMDGRSGALILTHEGKYIMANQKAITVLPRRSVEDALLRMSE